MRHEHEHTRLLHLALRYLALPMVKWGSATQGKGKSMKQALCKVCDQMRTFVGLRCIRCGAKLPRVK